MTINEGMGSETVVLGPDESLPDRAFTSVANIPRDHSMLRAILADLIGLLAEVDAGVRRPSGGKKVVWRERGRAHRLLVCDEARLRAHPRPCIVGFFGERRDELDPGPLEEANTAIVERFADHPGILSYSSVEMGKGRWANMVVHSDPTDREDWRTNPRHAEAVRVLSPIHYLTVRIYNGELTDHVMGAPAIRLVRTKYYDYSGPSPWRAERSFLYS